MTYAQLVKRRYRLDSCQHYKLHVGTLRVSGAARRITLSAAHLVRGSLGIGASGEGTTSENEEKT